MQHRFVIPELMDDPAIGRESHEQALAGLARLNRWSFADAGLWAVLKREAIRIRPRTLKVLDLATGSGDLPLRLAHRAQRAGLPMHFAACDVSRVALAIAESNSSPSEIPIHFFQHDVVRQPLPGGYDVLIASLFLHHLSDQESLSLLKNMAAATEGLVVISDLRRSRFDLALVSVASRLLSRSPVVHHDGPASVRAALTLSEARDLAVQAGLSDAEIVSQFPCRWRLTWRRPA